MNNSFLMKAFNRWLHWKAFTMQDAWRRLKTPNPEIGTSRVFFFPPQTLRTYGFSPVGARLCKFCKHMVFPVRTLQCLLRLELIDSEFLWSPFSFLPSATWVLLELILDVLEIHQGSSSDSDLQSFSTWVEVNVAHQLHLDAGYSAHQLHPELGLQSRKLEQKGSNTEQPLEKWANKVLNDLYVSFYVVTGEWNQRILFRRGCRQTSFQLYGLFWCGVTNLSWLKNFSHKFYKDKASRPCGLSVCGGTNLHRLQNILHTSCKDMASRLCGLSSCAPPNWSVLQRPFHTFCRGTASRLCGHFACGPSSYCCLQRLSRSFYKDMVFPPCVFCSALSSCHF